MKRGLPNLLILVLKHTSIISTLVDRHTVGTTSPQQAAQAHLSCSVKQIQMVRQSLPPVIETVTLQRYHFAHYKRDCTQLLKHCTHTTELAVHGLVLCERSFTRQEIMSTLAPVSLMAIVGDKWTMHQGSAERLPRYSVSLVQRICFIFQLRRQASIDE